MNGCGKILMVVLLLGAKMVLGMDTRLLESNSRVRKLSNREPLEETHSVEIPLKKARRVNVPQHWQPFRGTKDDIFESSRGTNDKDHWTVLHALAYSGRADLLEEYLSHEAAPDDFSKLIVDVTDSNGVTPLHVAAYMNDETSLTVLLEHGAFPNTSTKRGQLPTHFAARADALNCLQKLISWHALYLTKDAAGDSPLHVAARENSVECARYLVLKKKAELKAKNNNGYTPLQVAVRHRSLDFIQEFASDFTFVPDEEDTCETILHTAVTYCEEAFPYIHAEQDYFLIQDKDGHLAIHKAALKGSAKALNYFLRNQDADGRSSDGKTALHYAVQHGSFACVETLIDYGANPDIPDNQGHTPLYLACKKGSVAIVNYLLQEGANGEIGNPLRCAIKNNHLTCAAALLSFGIPFQFAAELKVTEKRIPLLQAYYNAIIEKEQLVEIVIGNEYKCLVPRSFITFLKTLKKQEEDTGKGPSFCIPYDKRLLAGWKQIELLRPRLQLLEWLQNTFTEYQVSWYIAKEKKRIKEEISKWSRTKLQSFAHAVNYFEVEWCGELADQVLCEQIAKWTAVYSQSRRAQFLVGLVKESLPDKASQRVVGQHLLSDD